jgi:hypothetical protein
MLLRRITEVKVLQIIITTEYCYDFRSVAENDLRGALIKHHLEHVVQISGVGTFDFPYLSTGAEILIRT